MRAFLFSGAAAMVFVTSLPLGYGGVAMATTVQPEDSPVLCSSQGDDEDGRQVSIAASRKTVSGLTYAPPPPPPPPPVVQPRVTPPAMVAPQPIPVPPVAKQEHQDYKEPPKQQSLGIAGYSYASGNDKSIPFTVHGNAAPFSQQPNTERYDGKAVSNVESVAHTPVSTFSVDVDTAAYANVRRMLRSGQTPPEGAVRTEEMINYFRYDYPLPSDKAKPFSITTNVATTPWNANSRLLRIGLRAYDVPRAQRPAANLVFLVDVSGSMGASDKLPLVKTALSTLADNLGPDDKVSIVVYAGRAGLVLKPTSNGAYVKQALSCLSAGGSTAGGAGINLAYDTARASFIKGGINRVILATDGDFNVGISDNSSLLQLVKQKMEGGITLTTLGFGSGNYNDAMMEKVADAGNGNYAYIDSATEARKVLDEEVQGTLFTVAKDVKIQVEFNPAQVSQYRLIGYENRALREQDFSNDAVDAGDIGSGHQVTAIYEIIPAGTEGWLPERHFDGNKPAQSEAHGNEMVFVKLRYKLPNEDKSRLIEQAVPASAIASAKAPSGDMAFATSVAAYGQLLRGDTNMGTFTMSNVRELAGTQAGYLRSEFVELTKLVDHSTAHN